MKIFLLQVLDRRSNWYSSIGVFASEEEAKVMIGMLNEKVKRSFKGDYFSFTIKEEEFGEVFSEIRDYFGFNEG